MSEERDARYNEKSRVKASIGENSIRICLKSTVHTLKKIRQTGTINSSNASL